MSSPENIKYQLSPRLVASDVAGETVILDYEAGKYFGLEGVGGFVWSLIKKKGPVNLDDLCREVTTEYDVDEATCMADLQALITNLKENGLIEVSS
jgi:hypothetical protein